MNRFLGSAGPANRELPFSPSSTAVHTRSFTRMLLGDCFNVAASAAAWSVINRVHRDRGAWLQILSAGLQVFGECLVVGPMGLPWAILRGKSQSAQAFRTAV